MKILIICASKIVYYSYIGYDYQGNKQNSSILRTHTSYDPVHVFRKTIFHNSYVILRCFLHRLKLLRQFFNESENDKKL